MKLQSPTEARNQTDCNVYIERAKKMIVEYWKDEWLVAGLNGILSLLQYAQESHTASLSKQLNEDKDNGRNDKNDVNELP